MTTQEGKKSIRDYNFQARRRHPRFLLCSICNVVSVTGSETDPGQERCSEEEFSAVSGEKRTEATQQTWTRL